MQQKRTRNQFWYLFGPLFIKWVIEFLVEGAAGFIYVAANSKNLSYSGAQGEVMNRAVALATELSQYASEIATVGAVITIPVMCYLFRKDRIEEKMLGLNKTGKITISRFVVIAVMGIFACVAFNNLIILSSISTVSQGYQETSRLVYQSPFLVQMLGLGILVPVAEELVYRGLLFKRMRQNMPFKTAMIFSALIFGVIHGNLVQFIYAGVLGLALAYLYEKTNSLKAPVILHVAMNITSVLATRLKLFDWMFQSIIVLGICTAVSAAVAASMFVIIRNAEE